LIPPPGMVEVCQQELLALWPKLIQDRTSEPGLTLTQDALIVSSLSFRQIYELSYRLQTVRDIYWCVTKATVKSHADLLKFMTKTRWDMLLSKDQYCAVELRSYSSRLYHESSLWKMIVEQLSLQKYKVSEKDQAAGSRTRLRFHLKDNRLHLLQAMTDKPHYQRGLRASFQVKAPLAEHYAAALIQWYSKSLDERNLSIPSQLYVPFAGSGTLAWEYLIWYHRLPPSLLQHDWPSETWPCAPQATIGYLRQQLQELSDPRGEAALAVRLCEQDQQQALELQRNLDTYGEVLSSNNAVWAAIWQASTFELFVGDVFADDDTTWSKDQPLAVLLNPPYGLRLGNEQEATRLYRRIGQRLEVLAGRVSHLSGLILVPNEPSFHALQGIIGNSIGPVMSFNQGGQHIRAVQFFLA